METSRSIVAQLAGAPALPTWRTGVGVALALVFGRPDLWILGALSFAARGGLLLLAVPIMTLPSPVGVGILLGPETIQSGNAGLAGLVAGGVALVAIAVLVSVVLSAIADLMAFERFVADPETLELRLGRVARGQPPRRRLATLMGLAVIDGAVLLPAAIAAALFAERVAFVLRQELIHPSSGVTLLARLLDGAREQLLFLAMAVVLAEILGSLASRHLLATRHGLSRAPLPATEARSLPAALVHLLAAPAGVLARAAAGWLVALVLVLPVAAALIAVWEEVRRLYLVTGAAPELAPDRVVVTIAFTAVWVAVMVFAGLASAIRAALWSAASLR